MFKSVRSERCPQDWSLVKSQYCVYGVRLVPEAGGCDPTLCQTMHHGRETGPAELRPICLAGKTGTADQKVPPDGRDWVSCTRHEGEQTNTSFAEEVATCRIVRQPPKDDMEATVICQDGGKWFNKQFGDVSHTKLALRGTWITLNTLNSWSGRALCRRWNTLQMGLFPDQWD